jgi:flagellar FliL protein
MSAAGPSLPQFMVAVALLTVVAAGIGGASGIQIVARVKSAAAPHATSAAQGPAPRYGADVGLFDLPPIITNLADPTTSWVRLQTAIVYDKKAVPKPDLLAAKISQDILAYMKTVTLAQIGGASGLEHLREDLNERASIRSDGHVREIVIQTLVVQ